MTVQLSHFIEPDLQAIGDYIAKHNPRRALSFIEEIERKIRSLGNYPAVYQLRPEFGPDLRIAVHGRYLILFRIMEDYVFVERVLSGYRDIAGTSGGAAS